MAEGQRGQKRIPRRAWVRMCVFLAFPLAGFALLRLTPAGDFLTEDRVSSLIAGLRGVWWAPLLLIGLYASMAPLGLPTAPLLVGGAAFGAFYGSLYNLAGLLLGACLAYGTAKFLGRDFVIRVTGERFRRAERVVERHGFWPLVQTRFLPFPFAAVNFGAALAGVRPTLFVAAAAAGLTPTTLIHTYFIARAIETQGVDRALALALYAGAFVLFNVLISVLWVGDQAGRSRRYRELVALRAERRTGGGSAGEDR